MKIIVKPLLALMLFAALSNSAYAQEQATTPSTSNRQKYVVDEIVAVVGSSPILFSELIMTQEYLKQGYINQTGSSTGTRAQALETLLVQKLLMTQAAIDSLSVNEFMIELQAEERIQALVEQKGSVESLEKFYNQPTYAIKDVIKVKIRESEMANSMQYSIQSDISTTPSEVQKFYRKTKKDSLPVIPEQYVISKIAILPASDINRKLDVKEELISLRDRILNGARFSAIARMYSDDVDSALQGGEMTPSPSTVYSQNFKEAVETLPIGQISQVVETEDGFHLIEVLEKQGEEYRVRHILRKIKFTPEERVEAIERLDSVANEIREGNLTFEAAVAKYSQDEESRVSKGLMTNNTYKYYGAKYKSTRFTKEELTTLYEHVAPLKKGEISNAFEYTDTELEESIIILKIDDIIPTHTANIDDDYSLIEELAIATKRNEVLEKWIDEKIDDIYIKIEDPYRDIFDSKSRWRK